MNLLFSKYLTLSFLLQVVSTPISATALLKSKICAKQPFPYGQHNFETFYNPTCIEQIYTCKDLCGEKCIGNCNKPHPGCNRGKLSSNFLFCPKQPADIELEIPYMKYELVEAKDLKEGKKAYKKTDKVLTDMQMDAFIEQFISDFDDYAKHTVEYWFLNAVKIEAFDPKSQPSHAIVGVSDFAQNLQVEKKVEMAEEHFHKGQIALFATVVSVSTPIEDNNNVKHSLTQVTSSNNK